MLAAPVGVDRPAERHAGRVGDPADDRLRLHLVEGHAAKSWRVESADNGPAFEHGHLTAVGTRGGAGFIVESQVVPAHAPHCRTAIRVWQTPVRLAVPNGGAATV